MNDPQIILFPHSYLSESKTEKILTLFGPLTIFQPFFMKQPALVNGGHNLEYAKIMTPPPHLNPGEEFKALLSECYAWMDQNKDRGYKEFLKRSQEQRLTENNTWEIREMIRRVDNYPSNPEKAHTKRWHMILHLARDVEVQRQDADQLLQKLKKKDSLLKGAIEDMDHDKNLLEDLPDFESDFLIDDHILSEIIEAWFALFGGYLQGHELLITFNRDVMKLCTLFMKEFGMEEVGETPDLDITFRFPDLPDQSSENQEVPEKRYFNESKLTQFKNMLGEFRKDPEGNLSILKELPKEIGSSFQRDLFGKTLDVKMRYIPPITDRGYPKKNKLFSHLSNKTIILMEEADHYE